MNEELRDRIQKFLAGFARSGLPRPSNLRAFGERCLGLSSTLKGLEESLRRTGREALTLANDFDKARRYQAEALALCGALMVDAEASKTDADVRLVPRALIARRPPVDKSALDVPLGAVNPAALTLHATAVACEYCGVDPADVQSRERGQHVVLARSLAIYLARRVSMLEQATVSYPNIGRLFGRDHSTAIYAVNFIDARRAREPEFDRAAESLVDRVRLSVRGYLTFNEIAGGDEDDRGTADNSRAADSSADQRRPAASAA